MNKDKSLEQIDIAKLLGYIFIFLLVCMVMIFGFIVPNIKEFKSQSRLANSQIASYSKASHILGAKTDSLNELKQENKAILEAFEHKFDTNEFMDFTKKFFSDVKLQELSKSDQEKNDEYFLYELSVSSFSDTPAKLYAFIDALAKFSSIIRVEFPIQMKADEEKIRTKFNIRVYGKPATPTTAG